MFRVVERAIKGTMKHEARGPQNSISPYMEGEDGTERGPGGTKKPAEKIREEGILTEGFGWKGF